MTKKTMLLTFTALIEINELDSEDGLEVNQIQSKIIDSIDNILNKLEFSNNYGWNSSSGFTLDENEMNCGRCVICKAWVTDRDKPKPLRDLNVGATVNGVLYCDEHLPTSH